MDKASAPELPEEKIGQKHASRSENEEENEPAVKKQKLDDNLAGETYNPTSETKLTTTQQVVEKDVTHHDEASISSKDQKERYDAENADSSSKQDSAPKLLDPLSYTQTDEFTSEIFKVQIHNLPKKFGFGDLKKRLKSMNLKPNKIKSPSRYVAYVCFRNEIERDEALEKISGHVWKGCTLEAKIAAPIADPYLQKRQQRGDKHRDGKDERSLQEGPSLTQEEADAKLKARVVPLWDTAYPKQLEIKTETIKKVLRKVYADRSLGFSSQHRSQNDSFPCELLPIVPSPVTKEYRNKNEFTVGYSLDGKTVMVGFRFGLYKDGITAVGDCANVGVVMPAAFPVAKSFCNFVSQTKWPPFRQQTATGHWQTLTVRTQTTGDTMVMPDFVARKLSQSEIEEAKSSLKEYYTTGEGKDITIKSLYFRLLGERSGGNDGRKVELLCGEPHVYESLRQLKFRISPEAFFQINTLATEKLYELIADWSCVSPSTVVLDICCGTGTIGLSLAKHVKNVVGVEMCKQAVDDAIANASLNGITNATFHCAKVEDVIGKIISSVESSSASSSSEVVAIVDPPRAGLHKNVIKKLRSCEQIKTLVYVSCSAENAMANFIDLIRPETGKHRGQPFSMMKAIPVDLFPGTQHVELVILFQRLPPASSSVAPTSTDSLAPGECQPQQPQAPQSEPFTSSDDQTSATSTQGVMEIETEAQQDASHSKGEKSISPSSAQSDLA